MSAKTIVGPVADRLGHCHQHSLELRDDGLAALHYHRAWAAPSTEYRTVQQHVPVRLAHGVDAHTVGRLEHLELARDDRLLAVCSVDCNLVNSGADLWFSPGVDFLPGGRDILLRELTLTRHPASVALGKITVLDGDLRKTYQRQHWQGDRQRRELFERAAVSAKQDGTITIHQPGAKPPRIVEVAKPASGPALGGLEFRSSQTVDVDTKRRQIRVLAVPYHVEVPVPLDGRTVFESFTNLAFAREQPDRIYSTREHDTTRLIGRVRDLQPFHDEGLRCTIVVSDTALGRETVQLAADQALAPSVGFQVRPGGEIREHDRRRVTDAILREVALVASPAYATRVLDVRDLGDGRLEYRPSRIVAVR